MPAFHRLLTSRWGPPLTGALIGVLAPLLTRWGNPGNMGVCVACFSRDVAGALGLHRAAAVQYLRPELPGFVLGALLAAWCCGEFKPRTGSAPLARFLLGVFAALGALVFLGCPWRVILRLSGGDGNALPGLLGLVLGISLGILLLRRGFSLGRSHRAPQPLGWLMPGLMLGMLLLLLTAPQLGRTPEGEASGPIFVSAQGPGSQYAPWLLALAAGLLIGFFAQRTRFCTVGGLRDLILLRDPHLFYGALTLLIVAALTNGLLGQFQAGFQNQPIAHDATTWNLLGMVLAGLAFTLAGGCPGRQFFLAGEGDGDAAVFILGLIVGSAFAHNFNLASSGQGPAPYGPAAVLLGLIVCLVLGFTMREPPQPSRSARSPQAWLRQAQAALPHDHQ